MIDLSRTKILIGEENLKKLKYSTVAIFGLGGVGGYALEAIVRSGVGSIIIADYDRITSSNINRQILSLSSTMNEMKTDIALQRAKDINPEINIITISDRLTPNNIEDIIPLKENMYAIDAIDEIDAKTSLIAELVKRKIPFVSSMGAGSRLNISKVRVDDISKTEYCPLAKIMRKRLRDIGIFSGVRCIYSTENPNRVQEPEFDAGKRLQGSISFMPGIFGLMAAGVIINDIIK
ncbi:MAG: tRNA threonylcarbamoyladenosine dehydratase [Leptospirales bacterium]|nr:tRNA threonylcarbamoyladenosine dehydratase [Leptospirales bacterium]